MTIAIRVLTYKREDGRTPFYLNRALSSILKQTEQDYKVFLIGDNYEDDQEFVDIAKSIIPSDKIYFENLKINTERFKYPKGSMQLWCAGGTKASNYCIEKIIDSGLSWACHLDHDDLWELNHLELIRKKIHSLDNRYVFIASRSTYKKNMILPIRSNPSDNYYPVNGDIIHSSVCVNWREIDLRFRDVFEEEGRYHAGDGDMWERLSKYMIESGKKGSLIGTVTCHHESERE